jgi:tetratricopeptide (TPR) repeat protein
MSGATEPVGTLQVALAHAQKLLQSEPALAYEQASEILKAVPNHPVATLIRALAQRKLGNLADALTILQALVDSQPRWAQAHYELGVSSGAAHQGDQAIASLRRAVELKPDHADAWRALGDHLRATGDTAAADAAYARHIRFSAKNPVLAEAAVALLDNHIATAESLLRRHLAEHPTDVAAIRMLAEVAARLGRYGDAENLLARCLELAPSFTPARHNYAFVLHRQNKSVEALEQIDQLLEDDPRNPGYRNLKAAILARIGEIDRSIELYEGILAEYPHHAKAWMSFGHALKTAGRQDEAVRAYRNTIERAPELGEAWWSLANLKTFRFAPADLDTMRAHTQRPDLGKEDRFHFHFAIGKALEDLRDFAQSFEHYERGNSLRRALVAYSADETSDQVRRSKALFTPGFFAERSGRGNPAADPIFIVGLPRSGSTLLEQILASHPLVEGTQELPDIPALARRLGGRRLRSETTHYPEVLAELDADESVALGEEYLAQTRIHRKSDAPFFIDKMPNNWAHVGLIHMILPRSKIIDARRHPLGCCLSGFKQHFARGQHFTYDLAELGRYYRDYVELMAHFDRVLPGRVHRVIYERVVEDTEGEVRRLLDYCGLPFDEKCLHFYETDRAVRTASSEQVRRPIFRDATDHWRNYEPWIEPLKTALGPVLDAYPDVPEF